MVRISSASGATLQLVARSLWIIFSVQIMIINAQNAQWDKHVGKFFTTSQCTEIHDEYIFDMYDYYGDTNYEEECLNMCLSHSGPLACTAFNYNTWTGTCTLFACELPVPAPAGDDPDSTAYSLKPAQWDKHVGKFFTTSQCTEIHDEYIYDMYDYDTNFEEECLNMCLSHSGPLACTAFNYNTGYSGSCTLFACELPVPAPAGDDSWATAYSLKQPDIDECLVNNGNCSQNCANSDGSYDCSCNDGFNLLPDNKTCEDINECQVNNGNCEHKCENFEGSYNCSCNDGFNLSPDGRTCKVSTDIYFGPSNKTWSDCQCPPIRNYHDKTIDECQTLCSDEESCTAINFSDNDCVLRACRKPVPPPTFHYPPFQGYANQADIRQCEQMGRCTRKNGTCLPRIAWQTCEGKLKIRWCKGRHCGCCIPQ